MRLAFGGAGSLAGQRKDAGYPQSFALAFAVHAVLLAILFLGVRVQSHAPQSVAVELWEPPPRVAEPPKPEPKPEPPKAEPPKAEPPKPEPKIEKADIVEKPAPKKPEPEKPEPKKPEAKKPEAKKPPPDTKAREVEFRREMREQLAREQAAMQDRQMREAAAREQAAARNRALATWVSKIQAKIRSNVNLPPDIVGNPEAIFDVSLLPTGEVLTVRLRKSSGHKGLDAAVERAILKSSPLPRPDQPELFRRDLELSYRPQDK